MKVSIQVWRSGSTRELTIVVGETPEDKSLTRNGKSRRPIEQPANRLGLVVSELSNEQKRVLRLNSGLLVEDIRGNAVHADLQPGDIILALIARGESSEVRSVDQFNKLLAQFDKAASITLLVKRGDLQTFVTIKGLSEKKAE